MVQPMANQTEKRICLGRIRGAHGLEGAVRLVSFTERPEDIASYGPLSDHSGRRRFVICDLRQIGSGLVARLEGVRDRDAAEALKGLELFVPRTRLAPLPDEDDTWYHADLIGLRAYLADGSVLGTVTAVQNFGAGDLLDIRTEADGRSVLVPFTRAVVPEVDLAAGRLTIDPPEGLLDDAGEKA